MIEEFLKDTKTLEMLMQDVLDMSLESLPEDVPIAAAIYDITNNRVSQLSCAHNTREINTDPTNHAEITALREAARHAGDWRLENCVIFSTLEPCVMCAGAIVQSRIGALVFGAYDKQYGACGSIYNFLNDPRLNHNPPMVTGILEDKCTKVLNDFFKELRSE